MSITIPTGATRLAYTIIGGGGGGGGGVAATNVSSSGGGGGGGANDISGMISINNTMTLTYSVGAGGGGGLGAIDITATPPAGSGTVGGTSTIYLNNGTVTLQIDASGGMGGQGSAVFSLAPCLTWLTCFHRRPAYEVEPKNHQQEQKKLPRVSAVVARWTIPHWLVSIRKKNRARVHRRNLH